MAKKSEKSLLADEFVSANDIEALLASLGRAKKIVERSGSNSEGFLQGRVDGVLAASRDALHSLERV